MRPRPEDVSAGAATKGIVGWGRDFDHRLDLLHLALRTGYVPNLLQTAHPLAKRDTVPIVKKLLELERSSVHGYFMTSQDLSVGP